MAFYNCTPQTSAFTLGLAASMEEQYAADRENFNPETINAVKTSLMGPLSGVGDSFFQGTVRLIAFGLGISLAQQGSVLGPILAMIISIVPSVLVTWFAGKLGYTMAPMTIRPTMPQTYISLSIMPPLSLVRYLLPMV